MAPRHERAKANLASIRARPVDFVKACQGHVADVRDVYADALSGKSTAAQSFADAAALWINGVALIGAFYGFPVATGGCEAAAEDSTPVAESARAAGGAGDGSGVAAGDSTPAAENATVTRSTARTVATKARRTAKRRGG